MTLASTDTHAAALRGLERFSDWISFDEELRRSFRTDYGKVVERVPGAVARPRTTAEVALLVRYCREHKLPIVGRGQGHTQTGQSTTHGVLLDTSAMNQIHEVTDEYAVVGPGLVWRDFVAHVVPLGLVPPTLTNNLGVTVGGTNSVAGLGVASFKYGAQVDNSLELEVVTGAGDIVVCSREQNRDLFDVVRSGLSQFGLITKIKTRLRKCKSRVRKYYLLYDDLGQFMTDAAKVMDPAHGVFDTLEAWCSPCFQGAKKIGEGLNIGEGMQTFAAWFYPAHLTIEFEPGEEPNDAAVLADLKPYRVFPASDFSQYEFCERLVPLFQLWDRSGYTAMAHPWMETILPWDVAKDYIEGILADFPPQALGPGGHILLWPCRGNVSDAPLFRHPGGDLVMGWGVLPGVPDQFLARALTQLDMASELSIHYGGYRYLSGYITFDTVEKWAAHFGPEWPRVVEAKRKYDPDGIMNPGFVVYPE